MTLPAVSITSEVLDYEALYDGYRADLVDRLRGFGPAADGLSLWVPDEDPLTSLRNLWDAAAQQGLTELAVRVGPATLARLDAEGLLAMAARFGLATMRPVVGGMLIEVEGLTPAVVGDATMAKPAPLTPAPAATPVPPRERMPIDAPDSPYADALSRAIATARHDVPLLDESPRVVVHGEHEGATLTLAIDTATHCVDAAAFAGAVGKIQYGVLEGLCRIIEGLPIQEAADHGASRLEYAWRDSKSRSACAGIVTPRSAAPEFALAHTLVRAALQMYRDTTGFAEAHSDFDGGVSLHWRRLDTAGRRAMIAACCESFLAARNLDRDAFELVAVEFDARLVLRAHANVAGPNLPGLVMDLERTIRADIDPRLEVYLEELRDRNKLRRLAIVEDDQ